MTIGELGLLTIAIAALLVFAGMQIANLITEAREKKAKAKEGKQ